MFLYLLVCICKFTRLGQLSESGTITVKRLFFFLFSLSKVIDLVCYICLWSKICRQLLYGSFVIDCGTSKVQHECFTLFFPRWYSFQLTTVLAGLAISSILVWCYHPNELQKQESLVEILPSSLSLSPDVITYEIPHTHYTTNFYYLIIFLI